MSASDLVPPFGRSDHAKCGLRFGALTSFGRGIAERKAVGNSVAIPEALAAQFHACLHLACNPESGCCQR